MAKKLSDSAATARLTRSYPSAPSFSEIAPTPDDRFKGMALL